MSKTRQAHHPQDHRADRHHQRDGGRCPGEKEALEAFLRFADGRILVAHNAHAFDIRFLKAAAKRSGISFEPTYIDTLTMAQAMYPGLHNYKQGTINKHLELPSYEAHRACEDSAALGRIFCVMLSDLAEKEVTTVEGINTGLGGNREVLKKSTSTSSFWSRTRWA